MAEIRFGRVRKFGRPGSVLTFRQRQKNPGRLFVASAERLDQQQLLVVGRQDDPVAVAHFYQCAGLAGKLGGHFYLTFLNMSGYLATSPERSSL